MISGKEINIVDPNLYLAFIGLFIIYVFLQKREWLCDKEKFFNLALISGCLFIMGLFLDLIYDDDEVYAFFLYIPLYSLYLFKYMRKSFIKEYGREPKDTWLDYSFDTPWYDRAFNILYFILGYMIPIIVYILIKELLF